MATKGISKIGAVGFAAVCASAGVFIGRWSDSPAPTAGGASVAAPTVLTPRGGGREPERTTATDPAVAMKSLDALIEVFHTVPSPEREQKARAILARLGSADLRWIVDSICLSPERAQLGAPETTLEELLFESLGATLGAEFEPFLKSIPERSSKRWSLAVAAAVRGWVDVDFEGALAHLQNRSPDQLGGLLASQVAGLWAEKDLVGLAAYLRAQPQSWNGNQAKVHLVAAWGTREPVAAFDWAWEHVGLAASENGELLQAGFAGLLRVGGAEAIRELHARVPSQAEVLKASHLLEMLKGSTRNAALQELVSLPPGPLDDLFLHRWESNSSTHPEVFVALLLRSDLPAVEKSHWMGNALDRLAQVNPTLALERFRQMPEELRETPMLVMGVARGLAGKDFATALQFVEAELSGVERQMALQGMMGAAGAQRDPLKAALDLMDLASPEQHGALWDSWAQRVAQRDPAELKALFSRLPPEAATPFLAGSLADQMAKTDMAKAGEWAASLPPGEAREEAYRVFASRLSRENPQLAEQWLGSMPDIPERTKAVGEFVRRMSSRDPERALRWAATLPNLDADPEPYERAARSWLQQNRDKALEYLRANPPPEKLRSLVPE